MKWIAKVTWRTPGGEPGARTKLYEMILDRNGNPVALDRTRVIRDLVPPDCTTLSISIRKQAGA